MSNLQDLLNPAPSAQLASSATSHKSPPFSEGPDRAQWEDGTRRDPSRAAQSRSPPITDPSHSDRPAERVSEGPPPPTPVEPSASVEQLHSSSSPTLDQYHHEPGSPTHHRRPSVLGTESPPHKLAPLTAMPTELPPSPLATSTVEDARATEPSHIPSAASAGPSLKPEKTNEPTTLTEKDGNANQSTPPTPSIREPTPAESIQVVEQMKSPPQSPIKPELSATPRASSPAKSAATHDEPKESKPAPSATPQADITPPEDPPEAKEETALSSRQSSTPAGGIQKAGRAPKASAPKKGKASTAKKPAVKKRKLDTDSFRGTPASLRSATPSSSRTSMTPAARPRSSTPVVASSSPAPVDDGAELFCICRRPDNHTWMIGCDGGCEDWFHGACVKIDEEDGNLIDKYICPNCQTEEKYTTWKPMCRLDGCREPARLEQGKASKYCSDEHGVLFMQQRAPKSKEKKRKRDPAPDGEDDHGAALGGSLSRGQLATLANDAKDADEFRGLGDGDLSVALPNGNGTTEVKESGEGDESAQFDDEEKSKMKHFTGEREKLERKRKYLKDREQFVQLVRERAKRVLDELSGIKDICGFDSRLSWTEAEFLAWRDSEAGKAAFETGTLEAPAAPADADAMDEDGIGAGVCQKKRCERHRQWRNVQLQEIRLDESSVAEELQKLQQEELDLKKRAKLRRIKEADGEREGQVEEVAE
ncbi:MAG: hypothetical protein M1817_004860 [Caeruleum heppii]|nr:MAG: hypothetical protein M1817_004860 [Caeruleum heppii]